MRGDRVQAGRRTASRGKKAVREVIAIEWTGTIQTVIVREAATGEGGTPIIQETITVK